MRLLLAIALLPGCSLLGGGYIDSKDLACEHDVYSWWGGMTQYAYYGLQDGDVVEFDFPPYEGWIGRVLGSYDAASGDYSFRRQFAPAHYNSSYFAEGFGTVFANGDLDILHTVTETDTLGEVSAYQERHRREGCAGSVDVSWPNGSDGTPTSTSYIIQGPDQVSLTTTIEGLDYSNNRTMDSDFNVTGAIQQDGGGVVYRSTYTTDVNLSSTSEWTQVTSEFEYQGTSASNIAGGFSTNYDVFEASELRATITYDRNYDGSGTGTYDDFGSGLSCTVAYRADGTCTYSCGADGTFDETDC